MTYWASCWGWNRVVLVDHWSVLATGSFSSQPGSFHTSTSWRGWLYLSHWTQPTRCNHQCIFRWNPSTCCHSCRRCYLLRLLVVVYFIYILQNNYAFVNARFQLIIFYRASIWAFWALILSILIIYPIYLYLKLIFFFLAVLFLLDLIVIFIYWVAISKHKMKLPPKHE